MVQRERRRNVRMKPTPELPVRAALLGDGLLREALDVVDISVGGMSLTSPALRGVTAGQRLKLHVTLATDEYAIDGVARWAKGESIGIEIVDAPPATAQAVQQYVAELLERGGSA